MATSNSKAVKAVFGFHDDMLKAIGIVRSRSMEFQAYSPFGCPVINEAANPERSNVRMLTAVGAVVGLISGFALAILCSMDWPLRTSAKAIASIPAFVVIGYECTILLGGLATLLAIMHFCKLPDILRKVGYDPRFSDNKFGLVISCSSSESDEVKKVLVECGAEEVEIKDAL